MDSLQQLFQQVYNQNSGKVYRLCLGYTGNADVANDLMQEVFVKVWQYLPSFRQQSTVSTWIYRIAVNTCHTYSKKEKRLNTSPLTEQHADEIAQDNPTTQAQVNLLYKCIAKLPDADRAIITMVLDEEPYETIAEVFNLSNQNLRVKIHRIKGRLTQLYKQYERL